MLHEIFQDPRTPYGEGDHHILQIHSELPDPVPIGHYEINSSEPIINEIVSRAEYLNRIQQACARHGEDYTVRFYDHLDGFDASVLDQLDEIRSLVIDPSGAVSGPEAVGRLPKLKRLSVAPRGKTRPDLLSVLGVERLTSFTLGETATPPIDLGPLGEAHSLRTLRLLAQGMNTEIIGNCASLTELTIRASDKFSLNFINRLQQIEVLKFALGKIRSISAIGTLPNLQDLSFDEVHSLEDLGDLQRFPRLRRLQINYQRRLKSLHVGPGNFALEHINVHGIDAIEGFSTLPKLKSFWNFDGGFAPDWAELPLTLTHFALVMPNLKKREKHSAEVQARGLTPEPHPDASFFYK